MLYTPTDFRDFVNYIASTYKDKPAFLCKEKIGAPYKPITYKQFHTDVFNLGTALLNGGFSGKKIAVIGENRYEWIVSYMAVAGGVGVIVPLDKELPVEEVGVLARRADVSAIIFSSKCEKKVRDAVAKEGLHPTLISMDNPQDEDGTLSLKLLIAKGGVRRYTGDVSYDRVKLNPDDMCTLLFTSGTTGFAKGVMLTHKNIVTNASGVAENVDLTSALGDDKVCLSVLPIHHTFAFTADIVASMYQGGCIAFCDGLKYIVKNMEEAKVTYFMGVPLVFESIYNKIWKQAEKSGKADKMKKGLYLVKTLSKIDKNASKKTAKLFKEVHSAVGGHLKLMIVGGAAMDPHIIEDFNNMGFTMVQGYGMTETAPIITVNPPSKNNYKSVGLPLPGVEVKIEDADEDGIGEIVTKSDCVMIGYYNDKEETEKVLTPDGWMHTGDYGYIDNAGYVYITGRKKNVIITKNGKNVFPEEVEFYLLRSKYIKEVVVRGVDDGKDDTVITAEIFPDFEELGMSGASDEDAINKILKKEIDIANELMPVYKRVKRFTTRNEEFPKTTTQKIKRW